MNSITSRVYRIGDASVTRILDTQLTALTPKQLLPAWQPDALAGGTHDFLRRNLSENRTHVILSVHSWLVRIGGQIVLVDTGIGNGKDRPFSSLFHQLHTDYLHRLREAGVAPEDVDLVLLTHLHVDHVGWNTVRRGPDWVPTFPNARYVYAQAEEDFFHTEAGRPRRMVYEDSVKPLIEAGLVERIGIHGGQFDEHFRFHPTPGHSPGHMSITLESQGETAIFGGDVMHSPIQLLEPRWNSCFCADAEGARISRGWMIDFIAARQATYFSSHFADTSVVRRQPDREQSWAFV